VKILNETRSYIPLYQKLARVPKSAFVVATVEGVIFSTISAELSAMGVAEVCGLPPNTKKWTGTEPYDWVSENIEEVGSYIDFGKGTSKWYPKDKLQKLIRRFIRMEKAKTK